MRAIALAFSFTALSLATGCAKRLTFTPFLDLSGFSAEVPAGWARIGDADFRKRPVAILTWLGEITAQDEGVPIGAVIHITRISRRREDFADEASWRRYQSDWLAHSDALFVNAASNTASEAKDFTIENQLHGLKATPMRAENLVLRTPDAYWVLNYTATQALFKKYAPAFEHLKQTAKLPPQ